MMEVGTRARALMDAAESTVLVDCRNPSDRGKFIVGFKVDRQKVGVASLVDAFNEMVDLADRSPSPATDKAREALADMLRILDAVSLSAGLGKKQLERVSAAREVLAALKPEDG